MEGKGADDLKEPKVGLYLRLSREDEGTGESMSIENQRTFLLRWAEERGWPVWEIYSDDGYTGTNFDRPAFRRMLRDIEAGRIDTVVTKDLSRLGRDQIGTMHYYQRYFPAHGVRYLAAAEGFDTAGGSGAGIALPFLAAANDFYTADISRKVRAALDARRRSGLFIGAAPPLGYRKDPGRKGALLPEEETAWVVRRVFETYLRAGSVVGTAKVLSTEGVPTPAQCRGGSPGRWSDTMVRRILTNPTYAGHLTQNRTEKVSYKAPRRTALPREMWTVVPHTHPPLVSQDLFDRVQAMLTARSYTPRQGSPHPLTGLAVCGGCGGPMAYVREGSCVRMVCRTYRKEGRRCTPHRVEEAVVTGAAAAVLRRLVRELPPEVFSVRPEREERARTLTRALEECRRVSACLYRDRASGRLTEREFQELFEENRARRSRLEGLRAGNVPKTGRPDLSVITRGIALALIQKVQIEEGRQVEIHFRFRRPAEGACGSAGNMV